MPDPALCTETLDLTIKTGTFRLFLQEAGLPEFEVGDIQEGDFTFTPQTIEHRRGLDNSIDGIFSIGKDYTINFTTNSLTTKNLAVLLNEPTVNIAEGCKIPLSGGTCVDQFGARMLIPFQCNDRLYEITFWRAQILSEFTMTFSREDFAAITGSIRALDCSSAHPNEPFGQIVELAAACAS